MPTDAERNAALGAGGWVMPHMPRPWGRGAGALEQLIIDEELRTAAEKRGVTIWDVRRPPTENRVAQFIPHRAGSHTILLVGSDCAVGKMTAALELDGEAQKRGLSSAFLATGQTGIMISGNGLPVDRIISDFVAGMVEQMVLDFSKEYDWVFVEGQGALNHPGYSPVTLGLVHGSMPDAMIFALSRTFRATSAAAAPETSSSIPPSPTPGPSDGKTRVLVTDSQSWESRGGSSAGGNRNGWGSASWFAGGARPQTAEIIKTLNQRCPEITVTNRLDKADFVLTLDHEGGKGLLQHHNKIAVFNKDGDVIFSKSTISLGNSVKDACQVISQAKK